MRELARGQAWNSYRLRGRRVKIAYGMEAKEHHTHLKKEDVPVNGKDIVPLPDGTGRKPVVKVLRPCHAHGHL